MLREQLEQDLSEALQACGLSVLGWFAMFNGPEAMQGRPSVLIGNRGGAMWSAFRASVIYGGGLDHWTNAVIDPIAKAKNATAFYPFLSAKNPETHWPFQQWASAAIGLKSSPLGLLIDPQYGLWQAFRAVLVFDEIFDLPEMRAIEHPCDSCWVKPCLTTCPADAVSVSLFDVKKCRNHLASPSDITCMNKGCIARNACPVGREYAYCEEQQAFHMRALGV